MEEIWKDIKGFEGLYQVSSLGNIKSLNYNQTKQVKLLNPIDRGDGYKFVTLKKRKHSVHRLVAQAFLGLDINNKKIFICHKDDNPLNNRKNNLFLDNAKGNARDMLNKGRGHKQKKRRKLLSEGKVDIEYLDKYDNFDDDFITF